MILLELPYVSKFLIETIKNNNIPVLKSSLTNSLGMGEDYNLVDEAGIIDFVNATGEIKLYTNSENALSWISNNLSFTGLPLKIELFNNKVKFRELIQKMYPSFYFREVLLDGIDDIIVEDIPKPFIIKPSVGFFSIGVYKVSYNSEWEKTVERIRKEIETVKNLFPVEVLDTQKFIIEECIDGEEFAFDAYFSNTGEPVILSILKHVFSSGKDVSDRVYLTSAEIINENLERFTGFLKKIGELAELKNFPLHVEVRIDNAGNLVPIEINPMRFGGFCTTADFTYYALGFNPYLCYYKNIRPKWEKILEGKEDKIFSLIVLNNSTGKSGEEISRFDYDKLLSQFEHPLELRKMDYKKYPVFGFLFTETSRGNYHEIEHMLKSDLKEFI